jgi:hypothetical protein
LTLPHSPPPQHDELLSTISSTLSSTGTAIIAFSHHIPGVEERDLAFFSLATSRFDLLVTNISTTQCPHMWTTGRIVDLFIYELQKKSPSAPAQQGEGGVDGGVTNE